MADRNRNQFVYEWVHGTDAEGEADVSDKRKRVYQGFDHVPEDYTAEQAKRDGCVVYRDTKLVDGGEYWEQFLRSAESKEPAKVRIMYQLEGRKNGFSKIYSMMGRTSG